MHAAASASKAGQSDKLFPSVITRRSSNEVSQNQANSFKKKKKKEKNLLQKTKLLSRSILTRENCLQISSS